MGVDYVTVEHYEKRLDQNLASLSQNLRENTYRPSPVKRIQIPKAGSKEMRPLGIPTVRDRVAQAALYNVIAPIFESGFSQHSYGWFEYFKHFKHSHRTTFSSIDSWIRMRLRSILRKRHGGKGRGRGMDHFRWPNAYFAERGLFSLKLAHASACQSS